MNIRVSDADPACTQLIERSEAVGFITSQSTTDVSAAGWCACRERNYFFQLNPDFFSERHACGSLDPVQTRRMVVEAAENMEFLHANARLGCRLGCVLLSADDPHVEQEQRKSGVRADKRAASRVSKGKKKKSAVAVVETEDGDRVAEKASWGDGWEAKHKRLFEEVLVIQWYKDFEPPSHLKTNAGFLALEPREKDVLIFHTIKSTMFQDYLSNWTDDMAEATIDLFVSQIRLNPSVGLSTLRGQL